MAPASQAPNAAKAGIINGWAIAKFAATSAKPVRYFDGQPDIEAVDLSSDGFGLLRAIKHILNEQGLAELASEVGAADLTRGESQRAWNWMAANKDRLIFDAVGHRYTISRRSRVKQR